MNDAPQHATAAQPLAPERLRKVCDPAQLGFRTTEEVADLTDFLGQERAIEAVRFGIGIKHEGYNLFAYGPPGTGKSALVSQHLAAHAATLPTPRDWAYVNNFQTPHKPRALWLPAGRGATFRADMEKLMRELRSSIASAFDSDDTRSRKQAIEDQFRSQTEKSFADMQQKAGERGLALMRTPHGLAFAPMRNGEIVTPDQFRSWSKEEQDKTRASIVELEAELKQTMEQAPRWERELRDKLRELNRDVTSFAISLLMDELRKRYHDLPQVMAYLEAVQADVIENAEEFIGTPESAGEEDGPVPAAMRHAIAARNLNRRYQVNLIIDNGAAKHAPVEHEDRPTMPNLVGRIEHIAQFGALLTDFNLLRPGVLHRANGGYLTIDARKLLTQPFAWDALKRALQSHEIRIENPADQFGFAATVTLEPEPIPLEIKIVLFGDPMLYYLLAAYDPDFGELFKVAVDFNDRMDRNPQTNEAFARLIATLVRRDKLRPFDAGAVARVIEQASRDARDAEKLTLHMQAVLDLLRESDHWAGTENRGLVTGADVQRAIAAHIRRHDRIRERSQEEIGRRTILIDTEGAAVGQINALSVISLGDFMFGRPSRITTRVRLGRGEVIDIEREVALGGPFHSKGVLILSGFLGGRFGRTLPIAVSATLVFEQSYGGVDGDSASSTELYALLSALSGVPIKQSLAVTGSVNQNGEVQAIGGVNEKIEGFFDVCRARGLTGEQGVMIPESNVKHLMLREDVVEAAKAGKFRIYAIAHIDQGIEILTGMPAGTPDADGNFPDDTINGRVQAQLRKFSEAVRSFGAAASPGPLAVFPPPSPPPPPGPPAPPPNAPPGADER